MVFSDVYIENYTVFWYPCQYRKEAHTLKRNYGIDLLRIVAMVFVIVLHLTGVGGICGAAALGTRQFYISQLFRIATFCAVNCYALISGYVGWSRSPKLSSLLSLWLKVVAFCVAITVFTQLRDPAAVELADLWKAFTPVAEGKYWYFNAYIGLFFFVPLLSHGLRHISGREALLTFVGLSLLVIALPHTRIRDTFQLGSGYSTLWLILMYLLGGLMGRFEIPAKLPALVWAGLYLLAVAMSYVPRMGMLAANPELWTPANQNLSMQYTNPSVVLAAVALVGLFARFTLPQWGIRLTKALSPHAFGVYLLHTHTLIFSTAIGGRFAHLGTARTLKMLVVLFGATAVIFLAGIAADWLISQIFRLLRVDKLLKKIDTLI